MVFRFNRSIMTNGFYKSGHKEPSHCLFLPFIYNLVNEKEDIDMNAVR